MSGPVGTEGLALFAPHAPSVAGSPTSEAAAQAVERGTARRQRDRILAYLRSRPDGATAGEIEAALALDGSAVRPRLLELAHGIGIQRGLGLIERTAVERVVPGHRAACVWRVAQPRPAE